MNKRILLVEDEKNIARFIELELKYEQFYALMESRDYFIFYLTANQASLIRKKDVDDLDAFREFIVQKFKGRYKKI